MPEAGVAAGVGRRQQRPSTCRRQGAAAGMPRGNAWCVCGGCPRSMGACRWHCAPLLTAAPGCAQGTATWAGHPHRAGGGGSGLIG
jgi:hypothetical protein